jgi:hypothetical protein
VYLRANEVRHGQRSGLEPEFALVVWGQNNLGPMVISWRERVVDCWETFCRLSLRRSLLLGPVRRFDGVKDSSRGAEL